MKKLFIHPWKPLPETISELAFFDAILFGLKHFTFLIKSCFRLAYGPVLDKDPHSTEHPPQKAPTKIFFEPTFQTILKQKEKLIMKNFVSKKIRNFLEFFIVMKFFIFNFFFMNVEKNWAYNSDNFVTISRDQ